MFRIECFVDDSKLVMVLHALAGKVKAMDVQPVVNAVAAHAKGKANGELKAMTEGSSIALFADYLKANPEQVTTDYVKSFLESIGRSPSSYQFVLRSALARKLITKHGKRHNMSYERARSK
jgi:hypothetical protein